MRKKKRTLAVKPNKGKRVFDVNQLFFYLFFFVILRKINPQQLKVQK